MRRSLLRQKMPKDPFGRDRTILFWELIRSSFCEVVGPEHSIIQSGGVTGRAAGERRNGHDYRRKIRCQGRDGRRSVESGAENEKAESVPSSLFFSTQLFQQAVRLR